MDEKKKERENRVRKSSDNCPCQNEDGLTSLSEVRANIGDVKVIMYTGATGEGCCFTTHLEKLKKSPNERRNNICLLQNNKSVLILLFKYTEEMF